MKKIKLAWSLYKERWNLVLAKGTNKYIDKFCLVFPVLLIGIGIAQLWTKTLFLPNFWGCVAILSWWVPAIIMSLASSKINETLRESPYGGYQIIKELESLRKIAKRVSILGMIGCLAWMIITFYLGLIR